MIINDVDIYVVICNHAKQSKMIDHMMISYSGYIINDYDNAIIGKMQSEKIIKIIDHMMISYSGDIINNVLK